MFELNFKDNLGIDNTAKLRPCCISYICIATFDAQVIMIIEYFEKGVKCSKNNEFLTLVLLHAQINRK